MNREEREAQRFIDMVDGRLAAIESRVGVTNTEPKPTVQQKKSFDFVCFCCSVLQFVCITVLIVGISFAAYHTATAYYDVNLPHIPYVSELSENLNKLGGI